MNNITETALMDLLVQYEKDLGYVPSYDDEDLRKHYARKIMDLVKGGKDETQF